MVVPPPVEPTSFINAVAYLPSFQPSYNSVSLNSPSIIPHFSSSNPGLALEHAYNPTDEWSFPWVYSANQPSSLVHLLHLNLNISQGIVINVGAQNSSLAHIPHVSWMDKGNDIAVEDQLVSVQTSTSQGSSSVFIGQLDVAALPG